MQTELKALKTSMNNAGEWIRDLEDRIMEMTQSGQHMENQMKQQENNIRDLWGKTQGANLRIRGIPEEEKEKGIETIFEEIMSENFPNLKATDIKKQDAPRAPNKVNPNRPTPRHIKIKMAKLKEKEF